MRAQERAATPAGERGGVNVPNVPMSPKRIGPVPAASAVVRGAGEERRTVDSLTGGVWAQRESVRGRMIGRTKEEKTAAAVGFLYIDESSDAPARRKYLIYLS